jgi:hypothetical protein
MTATIQTVPNSLYAMSVAATRLPSNRILAERERGDVGALVGRRAG